MSMVSDKNKKTADQIIRRAAARMVNSANSKAKFSPTSSKTISVIGMLGLITLVMVTSPGAYSAPRYLLNERDDIIAQAKRGASASSSPHGAAGPTVEVEEAYRDAAEDYYNGEAKLADLKAKLAASRSERNSKRSPGVFAKREDRDNAAFVYNELTMSIRSLDDEIRTLQQDQVRAFRTLATAQSHYRIEGGGSAAGQRRVSSAAAGPAAATRRRAPTANMNSGQEKWNLAVKQLKQVRAGIQAEMGNLTAPGNDQKLLIAKKIDDAAFEALNAFDGSNFPDNAADAKVLFDYANTIVKAYTTGVTHSLDPAKMGDVLGEIAAKQVSAATALGEFGGPVDHPAPLILGPDGKPCVNCTLAAGARQFAPAQQMARGTMPVVQQYDNGDGSGVAGDLPALGLGAPTPFSPAPGRLSILGPTSINPFGPTNYRTRDASGNLGVMSEEEAVNHIMEWSQTPEGLASPVKFRNYANGSIDVVIGSEFENLSVREALKKYNKFQVLSYEFPELADAQEGFENYQNGRVRLTNGTVQPAATYLKSLQVISAGAADPKMIQVVAVNPSKSEVILKFPQGGGDVKMSFNDYFKMQGEHRQLSSVIANGGAGPASGTTPGAGTPGAGAGATATAGAASVSPFRINKYTLVNKQIALDTPTGKTSVDKAGFNDMLENHYGPGVVPKLERLPNEVVRSPNQVGYFEFSGQNGEPILVASKDIGHFLDSIHSAWETSQAAGLPEAELDITVLNTSYRDRGVFGGGGVKSRIQLADKRWITLDQYNEILKDKFGEVKSVVKQANGTYQVEMRPKFTLEEIPVSAAGDINANKFFVIDHSASGIKSQRELKIADLNSLIVARVAAAAAGTAAGVAPTAASLAFVDDHGIHVDKKPGGKASLVFYDATGAGNSVADNLSTAEHIQIMRHLVQNDGTPTQIGMGGKIQNIAKSGTDIKVTYDNGVVIELGKTRNGPWLEKSKNYQVSMGAGPLDLFNVGPGTAAGKVNITMGTTIIARDLAPAEAKKRVDSILAHFVANRISQVRGAVTVGGTGNISFNAGPDAVVLSPDGKLASSTVSLNLGAPGGLAPAIFINKSRANNGSFDVRVGPHVRVFTSEADVNRFVRNMKALEGNGETFPGLTWRGNEVAYDVPVAGSLPGTSHTVLRNIDGSLASRTLLLNVNNTIQPVLTVKPNPAGNFTVHFGTTGTSFEVAHESEVEALMTKLLEFKGQGTHNTVGPRNLPKVEGQSIVFEHPNGGEVVMDKNGVLEERRFKWIDRSGQERWLSAAPDARGGFSFLRHRVANATELNAAAANLARYHDIGAVGEPVWDGARFKIDVGPGDVVTLNANGTFHERNLTAGVARTPVKIEQGTTPNTTHKITIGGNSTGDMSPETADAIIDRLRNPPHAYDTVAVAGNILTLTHNGVGTPALVTTYTATGVFDSVTYGAVRNFITQTADEKFTVTGNGTGAGAPVAGLTEDEMRSLMKRIVAVKATLVVHPGPATTVQVLANGHLQFTNNAHGAVGPQIPIR